MKLISSKSLPSPCPIQGREPRITHIGLVQTKWLESPEAHAEQLAEGISACAEAGASVVFLPELTLSRYPADTRPEGPADASAEDLETGPSLALAKKLAQDCDCLLYTSPSPRDQRGSRMPSSA